MANQKLQRSQQLILRPEDQKRYNEKLHIERQNQTEINLISQEEQTLYREREKLLKDGSELLAKAKATGISGKQLGHWQENLAKEITKLDNQLFILNGKKQVLQGRARPQDVQRAYAQRIANQDTSRVQSLSEPQKATTTRSSLDKKAGTLTNQRTQQQAYIPKTKIDIQQQRLNAEAQAYYDKQRAKETHKQQAYNNKVRSQYRDGTPTPTKYLQYQYTGRTNKNGVTEKGHIIPQNTFSPHQKINYTDKFKTEALPKMATTQAKDYKDYIQQYHTEETNYDKSRNNGTSNNQNTTSINNIGSLPYWKKALETTKEDIKSLGRSTKKALALAAGKTFFKAAKYNPLIPNYDTKLDLTNKQYTFNPYLKAEEEYNQKIHPYLLRDPETKQGVEIIGTTTGMLIPGVQQGLIAYGIYGLGKQAYQAGKELYDTGSLKPETTGHIITTGATIVATHKGTQLANKYGLSLPTGKKISGLNRYLQEINPKTRNIRTYNPVKYLKRPEWSEQVISQANYDKLVHFTKQVEALRKAKGFRPESYLKSVTQGLKEIDIPKEVRNTVIKHTLKDGQLEYAGSTITKNAYTKKIAEQLLKSKQINKETYDKLVKRGDFDLLYEEHGIRKKAVIPKKYEELPNEIKASYRQHMKKLRQKRHLAKTLEHKTQVIPEEISSLRKEYSDFYEIASSDPNLVHKGSITRGIEIYNDYLAGKLTYEDFNKYLERIKPKETTLPNGKKIWQIKDIDTEATFNMNKKTARQLLEKLQKVQNNLEIVEQKITVNKPKGRLLDKTVTLQAQNIEPNTPLSQKAKTFVERQFGRAKAHSYLDKTANKKQFDLLRLRDSTLDELNKELGYSPTDPRKINKDIYDIGVGKVLNRLYNTLKTESKITYKEKLVGRAQTIKKNILDAIDVNDLNKMVKQEIYLSLKRKTGELKPFKEGMKIRYTDNIKQKAAELFREVQERAIKERGEVIDNITPGQNMEKAYTFGDPESHPLQLLDKETYNLYPEYSSQGVKGKNYSNPYKELLQQYQAAIESQDQAKIIRSQIQLKRLYDSAYFKKKGYLEQKNYQVASKLYNEAPTTQSWPAYFADRMSFYRIKLKNNEPLQRIDTLKGIQDETLLDKLTPKQKAKLQKNAQKQTNQLFENNKQIVQRLSKQNKLNFESLKNHIIKNKHSEEQLKKALKVKNKAQRTREIEKVLNENSKTSSIQEKLYKSGYYKTKGKPIALYSPYQTQEEKTNEYSPKEYSTYQYAQLPQQYQHQEYNPKSPKYPNIPKYSQYKNTNYKYNYNVTYPTEVPPPPTKNTTIIVPPNLRKNPQKNKNTNTIKDKSNISAWQPEYLTKRGSLFGQTYPTQSEAISEGADTVENTKLTKFKTRRVILSKEQASQLKRRPPTQNATKITKRGDTYIEKPQYRHNTPTERKQNSFNWLQYTKPYKEKSWTK